MLKNFLIKNYLPGKRNLYTAFILRCLELASIDGYVAMVTQQSWMFLSSFAALRGFSEESHKNFKKKFNGILNEASIETLAHLGPGAFAEISGEIVNVALFTLRHETPNDDQRLVAFRLIGPRSPLEKAKALKASSLLNSGISQRYVIDQRLLSKLPMAVLAYWLPKELIEMPLIFDHHWVFHDAV